MKITETLISLSVSGVIAPGIVSEVTPELPNPTFLTK